MLGRVDNRLAYGMIDDAIELAALYAVATVQNQRFLGGNKRAALQPIDVCLDLNGIQITWEVEDIANRIIQLAQGKLSPDDLATWLREQANGAA